MMCLGRNWDPETRYDLPYRSDSSEPPPLPDKLISLVEISVQDSQAYLNSGVGIPSMYLDICLVNFYETSGRLGIHQVSFYFIHTTWHIALFLLFSICIPYRFQKRNRDVL